MIGFISANEYAKAAIVMIALECSYVICKAYLAAPSTVHALCGPDPSSWRLGNVPNLRAPYNNKMFQGWVETYVTTFATHGLFGAKEILTADLKAISFILAHSMEFTRVCCISLGLVIDPLLTA